MQKFVFSVFPLVSSVCDSKHVHTGRYLGSVDGAAVQLLPLLDWRPVLEALAPLQDASAGRAPPAAVPWATEFVLFALRACVLLQAEVGVGGCLFASVLTASTTH